jgi:hypothetical protein
LENPPEAGGLKALVQLVRPLEVDADSSPAGDMVLNRDEQHVDWIADDPSRGGVPPSERVDPFVVTSGHTHWSNGQNIKIARRRVPTGERSGNEDARRLSLPDHTQVDVNLTKRLEASSEMT